MSIVLDDVGTGARVAAIPPVFSRSSLPEGELNPTPPPPPPPPSSFPPLTLPVAPAPTPAPSPPLSPSSSSSSSPSFSFSSLSLPPSPLPPSPSPPPLSVPSSGSFLPPSSPLPAAPPPPPSPSPPPPSSSHSFVQPPTSPIIRPSSPTPTVKAPFPPPCASLLSLFQADSELQKLQDRFNYDQFVTFLEGQAALVRFLAAYDGLAASMSPIPVVIEQAKAIYSSWLSPNATVTRIFVEPPDSSIALELYGRFLTSHEEIVNLFVPAVHHAKSRLKKFLFYFLTNPSASSLSSLSQTVPSSPSSSSSVSPSSSRDTFSSTSSGYQSPFSTPNPSSLSPPTSPSSSSSPSHLPSAPSPSPSPSSLPLPSSSSSSSSTTLTTGIPNKPACPPTCLCSKEPIGPHSFQVVRFLGHGSCGEVYLVRRTCCRTNQELLFAMKVLDKEAILQQNKVGRVLMEQEILMLASSPYIVKLYYSFQSQHFLHFVIELCIGGTLFRLIQGQPGARIAEEFVRFYAAELLLALDHLHSLGYVHRDIKPENILISVNGHLKLADFDLSACIKQNHQLPHTAHRPRLSSFVGTPDYLSPEVVCGKTQTYALDFWNLGVLIYEMLFGGSPFTNTPMRATGDSASVFRFLIPPEPKISKSCKQIITQLLQLSDKRLGHKIGATEVMSHPWFEGIDWKNLQKMTPPFDPRIYLESSTDTRYFRHRAPRKLSKKFHNSPMITGMLPPSDPFYPFMLLSAPILADPIAPDPKQVISLQLTTKPDPTEGVLYEGWMQKQGAFRKSWKLRWFVLAQTPAGHFLRYYRGPSVRWLVDQIDLSEAHEVVRSDLHTFRIILPPDTKSELLFHLRCPTRDYHFVAPDLSSLELWISKLTSIIQFPAQLHRPRSVA